MANRSSVDPECSLHGCRVPRGRVVEVPDGRVFVRESPGPADAPAVVLLHGLGATAALNWFGLFDPLRGRNRIVALDLPGHGRSSASTGSDRITALADTAAQVVGALGVQDAVVVGYSLGGAVAQVLWCRHAFVVSGLVLAATARDFSGKPIDRLRFRGVTNAAVRRCSSLLRSPLRLPLQLLPGVDAELLTWARAEYATPSPAEVLVIAESLARFSSRGWIHEVDVPTSLVVTTKDQLVPPGRQLRLGHAIGASHIETLPGTHLAPFVCPQAFGAAIVRAVAAVEARMDTHHTDHGDITLPDHRSRVDRAIVTSDLRRDVLLESSRS